MVTICLALLRCCSPLVYAFSCVFKSLSVKTTHCVAWEKRSHGLMESNKALMHLCSLLSAALPGLIRSRTKEKSYSSCGCAWMPNATPVSCHLRVCVCVCVWYAPRVTSLSRHNVSVCRRREGCDCVFAWTRTSRHICTSIKDYTSLSEVTPALYPHLEEWNRRGKHSLHQIMDSWAQVALMKSSDCIYELR